MRSFRIGFPLLALALLLTGCASAAHGPAHAPPVPSDGLAERVDALMAEYDRTDSPGASVLVFRGEETLLSRGYGMADLEFDAPITPRTIFHVASVSKQFTAFAIAKLAAEGRLSLDDDVRRHIPELPDFGEPLTLRHLLHHTSGLRDQWNLWVLAGGRMDDVIRQEDLFRLVRQQRELNFPTGAEHLYSNSGYMLAAEVVKRATGQPFGEWLHDNVLAPLGMEDTQVYDDHERLVPGRAYSYRGSVDDGFRKAVLSYANSGATSLFTTTEDLALWLRNYGHTRVGGAEVGRMMRTRGILEGGDTIPYALGVTLETHRGLEMLQHGGADAGYRSFVLYYPGLDAGVVVLSNLASFNPGGTAREVAEIFFAGEMEPAEAERAPASAAGQAVDPAVLAAYTGDWRLEEAGTRMSVERQGARLFVRAAQTGRVELLSLSDSTFRVGDTGAEIAFHREGGDRADRAVLLQNGARSEMRRMRPHAPGPAELEAYVGRYYSPELETVYTVVVEGDRLIARHRRHGDVVLTPEEPDAFGSDQWFFGNVAFERDERGAVTGMRVSSGRVRNLWIEKLD